MRDRYRARLSGPLLDRIDIHVSVPPVEVAALVRASKGESSTAVRARVIAARRHQHRRAQQFDAQCRLNATLPSSVLEQVAALDDETRALIESAVAPAASPRRLPASKRPINKDYVDRQPQGRAV